MFGSCMRLLEQCFENHCSTSTVACRCVVMPGTTAGLYALLPNFSIEQRRMIITVTAFTLFVTSQHDFIFTFASQRFGKVCWHNLHIILHALSLRTVAKNVAVLIMNYQRSTLEDRSKTALNSKTDQFISEGVSRHVLRPVYWSLGLELFVSRLYTGYFLWSFVRSSLKKTVLKNDCSKFSRSKRSVAKPVFFIHFWVSKWHPKILQRHHKFWKPRYGFALYWSETNWGEHVLLHAATAILS